VSLTTRQLLQHASNSLNKAGCDSPRLDAELLLMRAWSVSRTDLIIRAAEIVPEAIKLAFDKLVQRRQEREPLAYILGEKEFWSRLFQVNADVLIPRPETELVVELALARLPTEGVLRVLDLGTGSGCILLSLLAEQGEATGVGVDASPDALEIAVENAVALGLAGRADFLLSDWFSAFDGQFDLIVSNPPYIALGEMAGLAPEVLKWEPMAALCAGPLGLEAYDSIAAGIGPYLAPGGRVLLETGPTQAGAVSRLFQAAGLQAVAVHRDMDGRERVVEMAKAAES